MAGKIIEDQEVSKTHTKVGRRPKTERPVYVQVGFASHIWERLSLLAKRKGVSEQDILRIATASTLETLSL